MATNVPIIPRGASRARSPRVSNIDGISSPRRQTPGNNSRHSYPPIVARPEAVGEASHVPQTLLATPPAALAPDIRPQQEQGPTNIPSSLITRVHPAAAHILLPPPPVPESPTVVDHSTSSPRRRRRRARCTCAIPTHLYAALVDFVGYVSIAGRFLLVTFLCIVQ